MQKIRNRNLRVLAAVLVAVIALAALTIIFATGNLTLPEIHADMAALQTIVLALSVLALVISIYVNVFLLRWRKAVSANDVSIVPSELLAILEGQRKALHENSGQHAELMNRLSGDLRKTFQRLQQEISSGASASADVLDAFSGLQAELDSKDKEIHRLRGGYDAEIFKRFVVRFLRVEKAISEELEDANEDDNELIGVLDQLHVLISDALMDCGLERFDVQVGANIRDVEGIDENYKTIPTEKPEQALTIAETISDGWRIITPQGYDYIRNARVAVYVAPNENKGN